MPSSSRMSAICQSIILRQSASMIGYFQFRPWIALQEKMPVTETAQKMGIAMVPVNTAADIPLNEQFIYRGFFQEVAGLAYPTAPYRMSASPVRIHSPAPALGANQGEAA